MHWTSTDPSSELTVVLGANTYITSGPTTTGDCCRNPNPKIKNLIGIFWYSAKFRYDGKTLVRQHFLPSY